MKTYQKANFLVNIFPAKSSVNWNCQFTLAFVVDINKLRLVFPKIFLLKHKLDRCEGQTT